MRRCSCGFPHGLAHNAFACYLLCQHFTFGEVQHEAVGTPYTVAPEVFCQIVLLCPFIVFVKSLISVTFIRSSKGVMMNDAMVRNSTRLV